MTGITNANQLIARSKIAVANSNHRKSKGFYNNAGHKFSFESFDSEGSVLVSELIKFEKNVEEYLESSEKGVN